MLIVPIVTPVLQLMKCHLAKTESAYASQSLLFPHHCTAIYLLDGVTNKLVALFFLFLKLCCLSTLQPYHTVSRLAFLFSIYSLDKMATANDSTVALSIIEFLKRKLNGDSLSDDKKESLEGILGLLFYF